MNENSKSYRKYIFYKILFLFILVISLTTCIPGKEADVQAEDNVKMEAVSNEDSILFLSTQLNPVEEANKMRRFILKDFEGSVVFQPSDDILIYKMLDMELKTNPDREFLIGGLHGDFLTLKNENSLTPVNAFFERLTDRDFISDLVRLGKFNSDSLYYIPWMQATYLMAANKKSLKYLPEGADIKNLTYNELTLWGKNMYEGTGIKRIGFPLGENGLMHRFFQGYLYPSYTGSTLKKFRSPEAVLMWKDFRKLWEYVNPASMVYSNMSQPLMTGDIWVTWDHSARLMKALETDPENFVLFSAPSGPSGQGYMVVLSSLGIPGNSENTEKAYKLIEYLTRPDIQIVTLNNTGFFPVVDFPEEKIKSEALKQMSKAVYQQATSPGSIATLLPMGLGESGHDFNSLYLLAFSKIILENNDINSTLNEIGARLQIIMNEAGALFWPPDTSENNSGQLE